MNVALVIERMDCSRGGRETSTAQIAACLARRGVRVTILCQSGSWRAEGVAVCELGRRGLTRRGRLRGFVADVQREIAGGEFDIVHAMLPVPGANVYQLRGGTIPAQRAASRRRRSAVLRCLSRLLEPLNRHRAAMAALERQVVADEHAICLPVSQMVADELATYYRRSDGVRVVHNGVDIPDVTPEQRADWRRAMRIRLKCEPTDTIFITVATNFELKGVHQAIQAFGRWRKHMGPSANGRLIVVGRDRDEAETYSRAASLRAVGGWVQFEAPTDEVFQLYAAADVCVLLSWYDPCSRVVLEATRWGIPSITTRFNGAGEVVGQSGCGLVVDSPTDIAGVADAMIRLSDVDRRAEYADACRAVADTLGMDRHVDELMSVYENLRSES